LHFEVISFGYGFRQVVMKVGDETLELREVSPTTLQAWRANWGCQFA
jgi:hypothetical protein